MIDVGESYRGAFTDRSFQLFWGRTKAKATTRKGAEPPSGRARVSGGEAASVLTQQQQLDLPGRLLPVVPQVPVDHLAALHRRLVLRAQRAPHLRPLPSAPDGVEKGSKHHINPHETGRSRLRTARARTHTRPFLK